MDGEQTNVSFEQVLGVLRRRAPLILLCVVLVAGAAYGFSKLQTREYTATASVIFSNDQLSRQIVGLPVSSSSIDPLAQEASDVQLVSVGDMAAKTASILGHGLTEQKVRGSLSVGIGGGGQGGPAIVDVSAVVPSPPLAAEMVNTYVGQFVKEQQKTNSHYFRSALALVNRQLAALRPAQRFGVTGAALQNRAQTLEFLSELQSGDVKVAQEAPVPTSASSPSTSKNTVIGGLLGLLIGLGLAFLLERLDRDRRIRDPEDLESIYRLPLLGTVPKSAELSRSVRRSEGARVILPPAEAEAFNLIRARLRFFNVDCELRTVLVTSAARGDGTTTVARFLAEAAARMGSRILLLEADLRHPTLAQQFDLRSETGLSDLLIGAISMNEATQTIDLNASSGGGAKRRTLDVLACGAMLPANPGELIESYAMEAVLGQAKSAYDLIVIDAPPLTAVSDAFPLLRKVDGVIIVGRIGRGRPDAAERLHQTLDSTGAPALGVIANGSKSNGHGSNANRYSGAEKYSGVITSTNGASSSDEHVWTGNT